MKITELLTGTILGLLLCVYIACNGGSTEIGNARSRVTGSVARYQEAATGVLVTLVEEHFVPGEDTLEKVFSTRSDCGGVYHFSDIPVGTYYINAEKEGTVLLEGPVLIEDKQELLPEYTLHEAAVVQMNMEGDSVITVVYIKGTPRLYEVASGQVELPAVPEGEIAVVGYARRDDQTSPVDTQSVREVKLSVREASSVAASFSNTAPRIVQLPGATTQIVDGETGEYSFTLEASDVENDTLIFNKFFGPDGLTVDRQSGRILWQTDSSTRSGSYRVIIEVADSRGAATRISWNVVVPDGSIRFGTDKTYNGQTGATYMVYAEYSAAVNAYRFSWGDGDTSRWQTLPGAEHTWDSAGKYSLSYQMQRESDGAFSEWATSILVEIEGAPSIDRTPPVITLTGADTLVVKEGQVITEFIQEYKEPGYSARDDLDGDITSAVTTSDIMLMSPGLYYIVYSVQDNAGNQATVRRYIIAGADTGTVLPPVIVLVYGDSLIQLIRGDKWKEPGFSVTDVQDGVLAQSEVIVDSSDLVDHIDSLGTYRVTYTVTNSIGLTTVKVRRVQVVDSNPEYDMAGITLLGRNPDTVILNSVSEYKDPGYTSDNIDIGQLSITVNGTVYTDKVGKYILDYHFVNRVEAALDLQREVWVIEDPVNLPPEINLNGGNTQYVDYGHIVWEEPGFSVWDSIDGIIPSERVTADTAGIIDSLSNNGFYLICYKVTNSRGVTGIAERRVVVAVIEPPEPPRIELLGKNPDTVFVGSGPYKEENYHAFDYQGSEITEKVTETGMVNTSIPGKYTIYYSVEDRMGNKATAKRDIWVVPDTTIESFLQFYGAPSGEPLPTVNGSTWEPAVIRGDTTGLTDIESMTFSWNLETEELRGPSITLRVNPYILQHDSTSHTLAEPEPVISLLSVELDSIPLFNNNLFVVMFQDRMVWIASDDTFAIEWRKTEDIDTE